jgi:DNA-binding transcriptional LysR family regulator
MQREDISDLLAFLAVARERSFTKAAGKIGVSQSALSHTIRRLETRLGLRLLTRTTRSVAPTQAGERLLVIAGPRLDDIEAELTVLTEMRDKPAGSIRITTSGHAARTILLPKLAPLLRQYPDIQVELVVEQGLTDIVAERYDAGVRLGEQLAKGMIAVPIGPAERMVVVGAPAYLAKAPTLRRPQDLTAHSCINMRLRSGLYAWEFEKAGRELRVRVEGQVIVNGSDEVLRAVLAGMGLGFVFEEIAAPYLKKRQLKTVLEDWTPPFAGFQLYYPSRKQSSSAFSLVVEALRYRR